MKMNFFHPCKNCLVKAMCKNYCYRYRNFLEFWEENYIIPLLILIITFFTCVSLIVLSFKHYGWWSLLIWPISCIFLFIIGIVHEDGVIDLATFLDEPVPSFALLVISPILPFVYYSGRTIEWYIDKHKPNN
jgi:hypothetical protein